MNGNIYTNDKNEIMFGFSCCGHYYHILLKDILYFESAGRKCILHTSESITTYSFYGKLGDVADTLSDYGFIRCHQSYLVSVAHATDYHKGYITVGGHPISVSEKYRRNIIDLFCDNQSTEYLTDKKNKTTGNNPIGVLVCISGQYKGSIIRIYSDITYEIGRDEKECEIVIRLPYVSRKHLSLTYRNDGTYEINDHSHNGTYLIHDDDRAEKLTADNIVPSGSVICFGDRSLQYRLI
ncbi:MAG: FHA domain-containing protein [Lachnospiraceae bacterium]|nr:FHA domain-containing protein [Lachnospiraceae bacterium]